MLLWYDYCLHKKALINSLEFINSWLQLRYRHDDIPGFVVAIAHQGEIIFNEAYGFADLEKKTELTTQHLFRIESHSKTFTATAIMHMAENGKLRIDDYVVNYLPWLKEHKDKKWQKVTIRQLMSHGAGVIRDGKQNDYWQLEGSFPDKDSFKNEILDSDLVLDNNVKLKYSNYGYTLLGFVIEAVSGKSYNNIVGEKIIQPLKLTNTYPEYSRILDSRLVTGYSRIEYDKKRLPITQINTYSMSPATGFCSTAEDLCKYFSAHMVGSKKLLDDESKKEMQRVQWHANTPYQFHNEDYGLGLEIEYFTERRVIGHGGGFPGQSTKSLFDPKDKIVVIVLTNCIDGPAGWIAKSIYSIIDYFQQNTPTTKPKHDLKKLEGRYMNLWSVTNIVVTGDKVVSTYPNTWDTLYKPQRLEYIDDTTFKVVESDSFYSEGELVRFNIKNGKVESLDYTGATMWPEEVWLQKQQNRKIVG